MKLRLGSCPDLGLLQTKSEEAIGILSEPGATSDKNGGVLRVFVRTRVYFRQNRREPSGFCPNLRLLQTKSAGAIGILSEPGVTSDKIGGSRRVFVRTWGYFRQNRREPSCFCPNLRLLQTKSAGAIGILSEPGATSDKIGGSHRVFVRTWGYFRQNRREPSCFCPNLRLLQTKSAGAIEILSEPGSTSDKIGGSHRVFVRTRGYFRQNRREPSCFCPNLGLLQTKPAGAIGILSEPEATSDKIGGSHRDFVRTRGYFRQNRQKETESCLNLASSLNFIQVNPQKSSQDSVFRSDPGFS